MTYNLEAMRNVLNWAEEGGDDDASFDLRYWGIKPVEGGHHCGTTLCLGGKAVQDAGITLDWREQSGHLSARYALVNGATQTVKEAAQKALGLTPGEADELFTPNLDLMDGDHDEEFALDFLRHLVGRAYGGLRNMFDGEVEDWIETWIENKKVELGID